MAKATPNQQSSTDPNGPGTDIDLPEAEDPIQGEIMAAAERAGTYVAQRGYGPNTVQLIMYIASRAVDEADLNVVIMEQLAARLLGAQSADDILQPFNPQQGKTYYGKPLMIESMSFIESDYEGFPWYVSLHCKVPATGESFVVTVGGEKVVMQAAAAEKAGALPMYAKIAEAEKATKAGFYPLELRPAHDI